MLRSLTKDGTGGGALVGSTRQRGFYCFSKNGKMKLRYSESVLHMELSTYLP